MKLKYFITTIIFVFILSFPSYADDVVTDTTLVDSVIQKFISLNYAFSSSAEDIYNTVLDEVHYIYNTVDYQINRISTQTLEGLRYTYNLSSSLVDFINSSISSYLSNHTSQNSPSGFIKIDEVRWTVGRITYYLRSNVDDVYCIFNNLSSGYGGFYFYSLSTSTTSVRVDAYASGYSGSQGGVTLNTAYLDYKYGYWGGGATPNNSLTPSNYDGYTGAVAFYGFVPTPSIVSYSNSNPVSSITPQSLSSDWITNNYNTYNIIDNGNPSSEVFTTVIKEYNSPENNPPTFDPQSIYSGVNNVLSNFGNTNGSLPFDNSGMLFITKVYLSLPDAWQNLILLTLSFSVASCVIGVAGAVSSKLR